MAWEKISDKKYALRLNETLTDIDCPYGKVEKLFKIFVGSGGLISADGVVQNDIISLISNFSEVGNTLLSTYGPRGEVITEGDCSQLTTIEVISLFEIATDVIENFIGVITSLKAKTEVVTEEKEVKSKTTKKDSQ